MKTLKQALFETFGVELEATDRVELQQNYCEPSVVDVVVTDTVKGEVFAFWCFDTIRGVFPYN